MANGAALVKRTGLAVDELKIRAAQDRIRLSKAFLRDAKAVQSGARPLYRTAVSRAYYALYHAMRAVVYCSYGGDDNEKHDKLPGFIPDDFPNKLQWENTLKTARYERNKADYEPYPSHASAFEKVASELISAAEALMPLVAAYVTTKMKIKK